MACVEMITQATDSLVKACFHIVFAPSLIENVFMEHMALLFHRRKSSQAVEITTKKNMVLPVEKAVKSELFQYEYIYINLSST